ncbi:MAG: hypothetical protein AAFN78_15375 [Pseudomonadota bacterium]
MFPRLLFVLLSLLASPWAGAVSPQELVDDGRLDLRTTIEPAEGVVPGQRMRLYITLSTVRWFEGTTRILIPDVTDLVIQQNQDFARVTSESRDGDTWTVQRWELDVFAVRAGRFDLPPIELSTSVSAAPGELAQGTVNAPGLRFEISLPEPLRRLDHWVASPSLTVEQEIDPIGEVSLGDAVERRITIQADDVMTMLLPDLAFTEPDGLRRYEQPAELRNPSSRGDLAAERAEAVTYIATLPGAVELPGMQINWWNTQDKTLEVVTVDAVSFTITGELPPEPFDRRSLLPWLLGLAVALAAALIWRLAVRLELTETVRRLAKRAGDGYVALRRPGLPDRLNPGGSVGESTVASRHKTI